MHNVNQLCIWIWICSSYMKVQCYGPAACPECTTTRLVTSAFKDGLQKQMNSALCWWVPVAGTASDGCRPGRQFCESEDSSAAGGKAASFLWRWVPGERRRLSLHWLFMMCQRLKRLEELIWCYTGGKKTVSSCRETRRNKLWTHEPVESYCEKKDQHLMKPLMWILSPVNKADDKRTK